MDYIKLQDYKIQFKHLISGPAPVGRILNYILLTGEGKLRHRSGHRNLLRKDNIASAWCSEFMVGLGLINYQEIENSACDLYLTENGKKLYELIESFNGRFDENKNPKKCKRQLLSYSKDAYNLFFKIFKASPVCINLCRYIENKKTETFSKSTFKDEYFGFFKVLYEGGTYNSASRTTTGDNRVPSLLQLCEFFNCMKETDKDYVFNFKKLSGDNGAVEFIPVDNKKIKELKKENVRHEKIVKDLVAKYGVDGNVAREVVARNSAVQELFRNNLIARYGCKCAICNKNLDSVLIASHIVRASESDVENKANCENGLLLCALHDKLFDRYLISFDYLTGKLLYSDLIKNSLSEYQLSADLVLEERFMTKERVECLKKHNETFFKKNPKN